MDFSLRYQIALLALVQIFGIFLFCKGFLLSRSVLETRSTYFENSHHFESRFNDTTASTRLNGTSLLERQIHETYGHLAFAFPNSIEKDQCLEINLRLQRSFETYHPHLSRTENRVGRYSKLVLFVLDAMRYDFMLDIKDQNISESSLLKGDSIVFPIEEQVYHHCMPIFEKCRKEYPERSFMAPFIADPPTTSLQRISGIISGTLPTFLEAAFNFDQIESLQDNLLEQFAQKYDATSIYFMGDDTWTSLFPDVLPSGSHTDSRDWKTHRIFPDYSFLLFDLNTVDNNIKNILKPLLLNTGHSHEIKENSVFLKDQNWISTEEILQIKSTRERPSAIISHFLGIDHCGHMYGPRSPAMATKLADMNDVVTGTLAMLEQEKETIFVAFGDHGMTEEGDHGGDSAKELFAGLFMFSHATLSLPDAYKKAINLEKREDFKVILQEHGKILADFYNKINKLKLASLQSYSFEFSLGVFIPSHKVYQIVPQLDLSATLSILLGISIPFSNVGVIQPELIWTKDPLVNSTSNSNISNLNDLFMDNICYLLKSLKSNDLQLTRYFLGLFENGEPGFAVDFMTPFLQQGSLLDEELIVFFNKRSETDDNVDMLNARNGLMLAEKYFERLISSSTRCRNIWAKFDTIKIFFGSLIMLLVAISLLLCTFKETSPLKIVSRFKLVFINGILLTLPVLLLGYLGLPSTMDGLDILGIFCSMTCLSFIFSFLKTIVFSKATRLSAAFPLIFGILPGLSFFSNSCIVFEDATSRYFLCTLLILFNFTISKSKLKNKLNWMTTLTGLLGLTRLSAWVGSCRDTQMPFCYYLNHRQFPILAFDFSLIVVLLLAFLSLIVAFVFFFKIGSPKLTVILWFGTLHAILFVEWIFMWYLDTNSAGPSVVVPFKTTIKILDDFLGKLLFFISSFGLLLHKNHRLTYTILLFGLVQRPFTGFSSVLLIYLQFPLLQRLFGSPWKRRNLLKREQLIYFQVLILYFLALNLFFGTGHQFTLTSIHWESAYSVFLDPPKWICALFVTFETFFGLFLPFIYFVPIIFPAPTVLFRPRSVPLLPSKDTSSKESVLLFFKILHFVSSWWLGTLSFTCFIMLKHLMLWGVFAPRFLFHLIYFMLASFLVLLVLCIFFSRNNFDQGQDRIKIQDFNKF